AYALALIALCRFQHTIDHFDQRSLGGESNDAFAWLFAAFEDKHRRDSGDAVLDGDVLMIVGVEFSHLDFAGELSGDAVVGRGERSSKQLEAVANAKIPGQ